MIFRARQRRQIEEFEDVDRQFLLDDLDVAGDRFRRIGRKTENVAGIGHDFLRPPRQKHLAIFPNLVLALLRSHQGFGVDVLKPEEDSRAAGARRFLDETGNAVTQRVDLQQEADVEFVALAQFDQAIEDRLPVAIAGEIVVGDEEAGDALRGVGAHDGLDVVGRAVARLSALHVDDGAKAALERAAAAGVKAGIMSGHPRDHFARKNRINGGRHFRHVGQIIVDRLGFAFGDVAQNIGHAAFGLAGEQMNAEIERLLQVRRQSRQHGDAAGDMKAAHDHGEPKRAELPAEIERARKLVGLHADQAHHATAGGADALRHGRHIDDGVALVAGIDLDIDVGAEHAVVGTLPHQPIDAGERVRRQGRAQPLDDIAIPVVMRRLDQLDPKRALGQITVQTTLRMEPDCSCGNASNSAGSAAALQEIPARSRGLRSTFP